MKKVLLTIAITTASAAATSHCAAADQYVAKLHVVNPNGKERISTIKETSAGVSQTECDKQRALWLRKNSGKVEKATQHGATMRVTCDPLK